MSEKLNLKMLLDEIESDAEFERGKKDQMTQAEIRTMFAKRKNQVETSSDE